MSKTVFLLFPYFSLLIVGLVLPSDGNHGILSPKSLAFLTTAMCVSAYFVFRQRMSLYQLRLIAFILCSLSFLLFWFFIGVARGTETGIIVDQLKLFLITIVVAMATLYLVSEGILTSSRVIKTIIYANFAYSFAKTSLVILHLLKFVNMFAVMKMTGLRFMSMAILGDIGRLQTSVDIVTPFLLFFVLQSEKLGLNFTTRFKWIYCIISIFSVFLSFSRFLIFVAFFSFFLYWLSLNSSRLIKGLFLFCILILLGVAFIGLDNVLTIIQQRFFSSDNYYSDQTRVQQINALMQEYTESPYLGAGLGGYVKDFVRDDRLRHSYEVQWVAFLMQFGFIGVMFLVAPLTIILKKFILAPFSLVRWGFAALFSLWVISGFTNPFLISLTSGIVYSIFYLASDMLKTQEST